MIWTKQHHRYDNTPALLILVEFSTAMQWHISATVAMTTYWAGATLNILIYWLLWQCNHHGNILTNSLGFLFIAMTTLSWLIPNDAMFCMHMPPFMSIWTLRYKWMPWNYATLLIDCDCDGWTIIMKHVFACSKKEKKGKKAINISKIIVSKLNFMKMKTNDGLLIYVAQKWMSMNYIFYSFFAVMRHDWENNFKTIWTIKCCT